MPAGDGLLTHSRGAAGECVCRMYVGAVGGFVRDKPCHFFATSSHARQGEVQAPPLLDLWLDG